MDCRTSSSSSELIAPPPPAKPTVREYFEQRGLSLTYSPAYGSSAITEKILSTRFGNKLNFENGSGSAKSFRKVRVFHYRGLVVLCLLGRRRNPLPHHRVAPRRQRYPVQEADREARRAEAAGRGCPSGQGGEDAVGSGYRENGPETAGRQGVRNGGRGGSSWAHD
jgi:hypothetical protein